MQNRLYVSVVFAFSLLFCNATKVVLTNDDGWAVAQIRAQYDALKGAGYDVVLAAPAVNKSGSGSSSTTPTKLTSSCEFNTCPAGSPAVGADASDTNINYVNAFPVDAVRYGIQTLSPAIFDSPPDLVISGTNVGSNLGSIVNFSGTVGAASDAALKGIPSIAFSGASGSQVSFTTLTTNPTASSTVATGIYSDLVIMFSHALLANPGPILPPGISINVNFASITSCPSASDYKFILTRINSGSGGDVTTCGTNKLPSESSAIGQGCIVTVSVFDASTKSDVNAVTQGVVLNKLTSILSCL